MKIVSPFTAKTYDKLEVGELFVRDLRGVPATCVRCNSEGQQDVILVLKWDDRPLPGWLSAVRAADPVVSLGTSWMIEFVHFAFDVVSPGHDTCGLVELGADGRPRLLTRSAVTLPQRFKIDLSGKFTLQEGSTVLSAAAVTHWRIWRDEAERNRRGAKPLVEFDWSAAGRADP